MNWNYTDITMPNINGNPSISLQKNDKSRQIIRNLFYLELLDKTKITNTVKNQVSFWQSLINLYNKLELEDRFFAPSSIDLFLRDKNTKREAKTGIKEINYNNLFYLFQQYQPKASIINPYTMYWLLNVFPGKRLFTPVMSWGSYLVAFMHSDWDTYVGVDVMPSICKKGRFISNYYQDLDPEFQNKSVEIYCQPSESLNQDTKFLKKYQNFFDLTLLCPPYFNFEIYHEGSQALENYPNYSDWLKGYWEPTVKLSKHCLRKGGYFAFIVNDYKDLQGIEYPLIKDLNDISAKHLKLVKTINLLNRTSPLRVNKKVRTEQLCVYQK
jgi:hypothetical protein